MNSSRRKPNSVLLYYSTYTFSPRLLVHLPSSRCAMFTCPVHTYTVSTRSSRHCLPSVPAAPGSAPRPTLHSPLCLNQINVPSMFHVPLGPLSHSRSLIIPLFHFPVFRSLALGSSICAYVRHTLGPRFAHTSSPPPCFLVGSLHLHTLAATASKSVLRHGVSVRECCMFSAPCSLCISPPCLVNAGLCALPCVCNITLMLSISLKIAWVVPCQCSVLRLLALELRLLALWLLH